MGEAFCKGDFSFKSMWASDFYDAQIEGVLLRDKDGKKIAAADAEARAKELAHETFKKGYASGVCDEGRAWAVAISSPYEIKIEKNNLNLGRYDGVCASGAKVFWVTATSGDSKKLKPASKLYALPKEQGYVSVVCNEGDRGPQEVYLAPSGKFPAELPESKLGVIKTENDVFQWINELRSHGHKKVIASPELDQVASRLSVRGQVSHDLKALYAEGTKLKSTGWSMIGEDRVRAKTLDEARLLLWISPLHRDLLLNGYASHVGVYLSVSEDVFLQLTFARKRL